MRKRAASTAAPVSTVQPLTPRERLAIYDAERAAERARRLEQLERDIDSATYREKRLRRAEDELYHEAVRRYGAPLLRPVCGGGR